MTDVVLDHESHVRQLLRAADTFTEVLRTGDLAAPVPACPGWTLTDLTHHLGAVHRWARTAIVEARPSDEDEQVGPRERQALAEWYREGADALLETLRTHSPDAPCWAFGTKPHTVAFWFRRQAHETAMHAWDALSSQGPGPRPAFDDAFALDGIDEVCRFFFPRQVRLGRIPPLTQALAIEPDGTSGRWVVAGDGVGAHAAGEPVAATVGGPADALLLLLWNRVDLSDDGFRVTGDDTAARAVLSGGIVP